MLSPSADMEWDIFFFFFMSLYTLITHKSSLQNMCPADVEAWEKKALSIVCLFVYMEKDSLREN